MLTGYVAKMDARNVMIHLVTL